jgi:hypothetical protein
MGRPEWKTSEGHLELELPDPFRAYFTARTAADPRTIPGVDDISWLIQEHGDRVLHVETPVFGTTPGDGQVTDRRGLLLGIRTADCFPVYLVDPDVPCLGLVHAGWRSSERRIVERAVRMLVETFGAKPGTMIAAFGPGICTGHYEVGPEFRDRFDGFVERREGKLYLDLEGFNRSLLLSSGLQKENIVPAPFCTFERSDLFFSYRRDGRILGEMWALLGMR